MTTDRAEVKNQPFGHTVFCGLQEILLYVASLPYRNFSNVWGNGVIYMHGT